MSTIVYGAIMCLGISLIITVHEFGHFLVARLSGVLVTTFSVGFGKPLLSFRRGVTEYRLGRIPLGGYIQVVGESSNDEDNIAQVEQIKKSRPEIAVVLYDRSRWFCNASGKRRFLITSAGPAASLFFGFILMAAGCTLLFAQGMPLSVGSIPAESQAATRGLKPGDIFLAIDGKNVSSEEDFQAAVAEISGDEYQVQVLRGEQTINLALPDSETLKEVEVRYFERQPLWLSCLGGPLLAAKMLEAILSEVLGTILQPIGFFSGLGGPVTAVSTGTDVMGSSPFGKTFVGLCMIGLFSISIGLFNLIPFPPLDGGRMVEAAISMAIRGPVPVKVLRAYRLIGVLFVIVLFGSAIFNDILTLFT